VLHGVDTVPLNVACTYKHNMHFVRISKLITTVRHIYFYPGDGLARGLSRRMHACCAAKLLCSVTGYGVQHAVAFVNCLHLHQLAINTIHKDPVRTV